MSGNGKYQKKFNYKKGGGKGKSNTSNNTKNKKQLSDWVYQLGTAKQASDYENTTSYLVNYIQSKFEYGEDIGRALETLQHFDPDTVRPTVTLTVVKITEGDATVDKVE